MTLRRCDNTPMTQHPLLHDPLRTTLLIAPKPRGGVRKIVRYERVRFAHFRRLFLRFLNRCVGVRLVAIERRRRAAQVPPKRVGAPGYDAAAIDAIGRAHGPGERGQGLRH